ncbi:MAG: GNAT family N-acetyltransferase [Oscillospiraceae bacterium]
MEYRIRLAKGTDAKAVHDIYGAYVPLDYVTFTVDNPDVESYRRKIITTLEKYPFLIAEDSTGKVLGYVYGSPLRPHDAYQWNVEWTIVLAPDAPKRRGIATALYGEFAAILEKQGYRYIYGVIVDTNEASLAFHKSLGFIEVGHFENAGFKLGAWRGIRWLVKQIGTDNGEPKTPLGLSEVIGENLRSEIL